MQTGNKYKIVKCNVINQNCIFRRLLSLAVFNVSELEGEAETQRPTLERDQVL